MGKIKKYAKEIYGKKFKKYKLTIYLFFILFAAGIVLGVFLSSRIFSAFGESYFLLIDGISRGGRELMLEYFNTAFGIYLTILFAVMFFSITVYAPFVCGAICLLRGIVSGYTISLMTSTAMRGEVRFFIIETVFSSLEAILLIMYCAFTTSIALRIFSDEPPTESPMHTLFGGTLFNSGGFRERVNYKFLVSFTGFTLLFAVCGGILILGKAALFSI